MPTYTYRCSDGHEFDEVRRVAERDAHINCAVEVDLDSPSRATALCGRAAERVEIPSGKAPAYVTRPGVGDRSPFSRDRAGK